MRTHDYHLGYAEATKFALARARDVSKATDKLLDEIYRDQSISLRVSAGIGFVLGFSLCGLLFGAIMEGWL